MNQGKKSHLTTAVETQEHSSFLYLHFFVLFSRQKSELNMTWAGSGQNLIQIWIPTFTVKKMTRNSGAKRCELGCVTREINQI